VSSPFAIGPIAVFALAIIAVVVVLLVVVVRPLRRLAMTEGALRSAKSAEVRVRARGGIAILAAAVVVVVVVSIATTTRGASTGQLLAVTALLALSAAILVFVIAPTPEFFEPRSVRSAELSRRGPRDFVKRRTLLMPVAAAFILGVLVAVFWLVADPDGKSISHVSSTGLSDLSSVSSTSGPFPGNFYGIPILAALVLLCALTATAIVRIAAAPRPTEESLRAADDATRTLSIRAVAAASSSAIVATVSGVLLFAGNSTANAGAQFSFRVNSVPVASFTDPVFAAFMTLELVGAVIAVCAAILLIALAIGNALRPPFAATAAPVEQPA
jgi:hypothetical protein